MGDFHDGVPLWLRNLIADVRVTLYEDDCDCDQLDINDYFCLTCSLYRCTICSGVSADCLAAGHVSILIQRQNRMKVVQYMEVSDHVNCSAVRRYPHGENNERVLVVRRKGLPLAPRNGTSIPCAYSRCDYYFSGLPDPHDQYANPRRLYCSLSCMAEDRRLSAQFDAVIATISAQFDAVSSWCVPKPLSKGMHWMLRRGPATPPSPLPEVAAANDDNYGSDVKEVVIEPPLSP